MSVAPYASSVTAVPRRGVAGSIGGNQIQEIDFAGRNQIQETGRNQIQEIDLAGQNQIQETNFADLILQRGEMGVSDLVPPAWQRRTTPSRRTIASVSTTPSRRTIAS
eukprot:1403148-Rhodomonas_salina.1